MKLLARCDRLRASCAALREAVEQTTGESFCSVECLASFYYHCWADPCCVSVEKETAEKRATELEEELNSLRKEREDRRAEEEAAARARDALASRLRSMADGLSGESSKFLNVRRGCSC